MTTFSDDVHGATVRESIFSGFDKRLAAVVGDESARAFARRCGLSDSHIRKMIAGKSEPTRIMLIRIARAAGVSIDWLATGQGDPQGKPPREKLDVGRLETAIRVVEDYLEEHDLEMRPDKKAQAIEMLYERFIDWEGEPDALQRLMKLAS